MQTVAFYLVLIYQSYPIALFSLMAEKNFQKFGARENPQKCSRCRQPGHNKGSSRCPVNIKNAATAALAKERQNEFSEDRIREKNNNYGNVSNSSNLSIKKFSPNKIPVLSNDFCSNSSDSSKISNSDARFGTTFRATIVSDQFPLDLPQMNVQFAGPPLKEDVLEEISDAVWEKLMEDSPSLEEVEQIVEDMITDSDGEDFITGLTIISGDEERKDIAIVAKGSEYIEASIADDEWMQHRQGLVTFKGRGPPRAGRGSGSGILSSPSLLGKFAHLRVIAHRNAGFKNLGRHLTPCEFPLLRKTFLLVDP